MQQGSPDTHNPSNRKTSMTNENRESDLGLQDAVYLFMETAGQTTDKFNARQACLYTGLQLEELAEKIKVISEGCVSPGVKLSLGHLAFTLDTYGKDFKRGMHEGDILRCNHAELIDADFDLAWVSVAAAHSTSLDAERAFAHGSHTNLAKFIHDENGTLVCSKDENGKIQKPADWTPPDFTPYVDPTPRS